MKHSQSEVRQAVVLVWRQLTAISRTTHLESMQQPTVLLLTLCGVTATALIPLLQFHQFGEPGRLARDGALAYQLTLGLVLAVVAAAAAVQSIGKFLGIVRMLAQFWYGLLAAMLIATRIAYRISEIDGEPVGLTDTRAQTFLLLATPLALLIAGILNNRRRVRFCIAAFRTLLAILTVGLLAALGFDRAGVWHPAVANLDLRILPASLLILAALLLFASLATALSTRLKSGVTMISCFMVLALGLSVDALLGPASPLLLRGCARLLPNIQSFWLCDALTNGGTISAAYLLTAVLYACAWSTAALAFGLLAFRGRDIN
jgi:hypothetical protein